MSRTNPRYHRTNPPLPNPSGDVAYLTIQGEIEGQETINGFYYLASTTGNNVTILAALLLAFRTAVEPKYTACLTTDWSLTGYRAIMMTQPTMMAQTIYPATPVGGGIAPPHEPTQIAALFSKYTAYRGQHGRGRSYLPAVPTSGVNTGGGFDSQLTTAQTSLMLSLIAQLETTITTGAVNWSWALFSRLNYNKVSGSGGGAAIITQCTTRPLLATIRRRRIGRGK